MRQPIQLKLTASAENVHLSRLRWQRYLLPVLALACFAISAQGHPIDGGLYTTYSFILNNTKVSWVVCGHTKQTQGCFDGGSIGPFGKVGALLEGPPSIDATTNTVTRAIYVIDVAAGSSHTGVDLNVYTKKDVISPTFDTTTVVLSNTISLPLTGGTSALTSMAANKNFLFVGTDQTPYAVSVAKNGFAVTQTGGFSPPINVTGITADAYGYVTVTFGTFGSGANGFYLFGPDSNSSIADGGGASFMLNTTQAILPSTFQ